MVRNLLLLLLLIVVVGATRLALVNNADGGFVCPRVGWVVAGRDDPSVSTFPTLPAHPSDPSLFFLCYHDWEWQKTEEREEERPPLLLSCGLGQVFDERRGRCSEGAKGILIQGAASISDFWNE